MNINGISVRFRGDVHLPRCRRKRGGGVTNSFGNQEENGWRQGDMEVGGGERGGGGFDEEAKGGERRGDEAAAGKREQ